MFLATPRPTPDLMLSPSKTRTLAKSVGAAGGGPETTRGGHVPGSGAQSSVSPKARKWQVALELYSHHGRERGQLPGYCGWCGLSLG